LQVCGAAADWPRDAEAPKMRARGNNINICGRGQTATAAGERDYVNTAAALEHGGVVGDCSQFGGSA